MDRVELLHNQCVLVGAPASEPAENNSNSTTTSTTQQQQSLVNTVAEEEVNGGNVGS